MVIVCFLVTPIDVLICMINFIVNLTMEPAEIGVVLKQRQGMGLWARRLDIGNGTNVGSPTALLRAELGLH